MTPHYVLVIPFPYPQRWCRHLWLTTDSLDQTTINNPSIWPTNSTIYQVLVTGSNNCSDTGSISITVNSLPNIDAGVNVDVCLGDTAQLNASGGVDYEWLTTTTISNTTTSNPNVWPTDTLIYQLKEQMPINVLITTRLL